ncbi:MAG: lipoprotein insertase outer membrane protein LolB [Nitrincola sp.]|nr:lipoprotein insertase outer membrane protein LolB [Nitrincola sp.]
MKKLLLLGILLLLSACSRGPVLPPPDRGEQAWVYDLEDWMFDARISISQPLAERNDSARINWEQQQSDYKIHLSAGPFNQTVAIMTGRPGHAEIQVAGEDDRYAARSPEALMQAILGWNLPIRHAVWWVRGVPDPTLPHGLVAEDSNYRFIQAGWDIDILRFQEVSPNHRLPARMRMMHNDLTVNLVIGRWELTQ